MFKIIKEYPESKHFSSAINGTLKLAHKIDAEILAAITQALQDSQTNMRILTGDRYDSLKNKHKNLIQQAQKSAKKAKNWENIKRSHFNHPAFIALMNKRLTIVYACVEITSSVGYIEEIDEGVSLRCLYEVLRDILELNFDVDNFTRNEKISILKIMQKMFIKKKSFSIECVAAYVKILTSAMTQVKKDWCFVFSVLHLIKNIMSVSFPPKILKMF